MRGRPIAFSWEGVKTVDRYILREWLKVFGLTLGVTVGLLVLNDLYNNFSDLVEYRATARQVALYYLTTLPGFIPVLVPISLLLSLLFSLGNLHRNSEFVAMRAAGMSISRITRTLWISGVVISMFLLFVNARLAPWSVEHSRAVWENMEFAHEAARAEEQDVGIVRTLAFDNFQERRLWFMNRFSEYTYRGFGVAVHQLDSDRRERERVMAREVYYDDFREHWVFISGRHLTFDPKTGDMLATDPFDEKVVPELTESPRVMVLSSKRIRDLSFNELRRMMDVVDPENPMSAAYSVRYYSIIAGAFSGILIVGLAVPFATTGIRTNPMVGVSKSIGLFLGYYLLENIGRILGEREILPPIVSAWMPLMVMAVLAVWLFKRVR